MAAGEEEGGGGQDEVGWASRGQTTKCCDSKSNEKPLARGVTYSNLYFLKYHSACHVGNRLQVKEERSGTGRQMRSYCHSSSKKTIASVMAAGIQGRRWASWLDMVVVRVKRGSKVSFLPQCSGVHYLPGLGLLCLLSFLQNKDKNGPFHTEAEIQRKSGLNLVKSS